VIASFLLSFLAALALFEYTGGHARRLLAAREAAFEESAIRRAVTAASLVTAEELAGLRGPGDVRDPAYAELKSRLDAYARAAGLVFVYFFRPFEAAGKANYIIDNDYDEATRVGLDRPPLDISMVVGYEPAAAEGRPSCSPPGFYFEGWYGLVSCYAPVRSADGRVEAVAGVDLDDRELRRYRSLTRALLTLRTAALALVAVFGIASVLSSRRASARAYAALRAKRLFLARAVRGIRGSAEAAVSLAARAEEAYGTAEGRRALEGASLAARSLAAYIDDLYDISLVERGALTLDPGRYRTGEVLEEAASVARASGRPALVEVSRLPGLPWELVGDAARVRGIILNLLDAAAALPPGGPVRLSAGVRPSGPLARPGAGAGRPGRLRMFFLAEGAAAAFRREDVESLFAELSLAESGESAAATAALGLSYARGLARAMGGDVCPAEAPGGGVALLAEIVQLECVPEKAASAPAGSSAPAGPAGAGAPGGPPSAAGGRGGARPAEVSRPGLAASEANVLVVDDVQFNLVVAEGLISPYGARVFTARGGLEALRELGARDFDLVLLDHMMPGMDGIETLSKLRAMDGGRLASLPVVAFSANAMSGMKEFFLERGFDDFLAKPVDLRELEALLRRWLPEGKFRPPADCAGG
jgi:CheY-like chemotaxis protein